MSERFHYLKCDSHNYWRVVNGIKSFELRKDDRDWVVGDYLILKEFKEKTETGEQALVVIQNCLVRYEGLESGYCILGIRFLATLEMPNK